MDFGVAGSMDASVVVTGQSWVTSSSKIICARTLFATADRTDAMEDALIENLSVAVSARVAGVGFTVHASAGKGRAVGKYLVQCVGG